MNKITLSLVLALCTLTTFAQNWDVNTLEKINGIDNRFITDGSKFLSTTTPILVVGIPSVMALYGLIDKSETVLKDGIYIGTSVIGAFAVTYGIKYLVDRERPYDKYGNKIIKRDSESSPSFPSTHTATAFSLATSLSIKYPKWYVIAPSALWACSVGFSRMQQGVHYPTDVLAGAIVGSGCAIANIYVNKWLNGWLFPTEKKKTLNY